MTLFTSSILPTFPQKAAELLAVRDRGQHPLLRRVRGESADAAAADADAGEEHFRPHLHLHRLHLRRHHPLLLLHIRPLRQRLRVRESEMFWFLAL